MFSSYKNVFFLAVACILLYHLPFSVTGFSTDVWTRLSRIQEWATNGFPIWEIKMMGQNYPYGHEMHWTRPMDVIGYVFAWPFIPAYGLKKSLEMMAHYVPFLMCLLAFGMFFYGIKSYVRPKIAFAAFILFSWGIGYAWGQSAVGYFDHHILHFALLISLISFSGQSFIAKKKSIPLTCAALVTALGTSLTAEFFINAVLVLIPFGYGWLRFNNSLKPALFYMSVVTLSLMTLVVLDPPMAGIFSFDIYRISLLQVVLATGLTVALAALIGLFYLIRNTGLRRFIFGTLAVTGYGVTVLICLNTVLIVPMADPWMTNMWMGKVSEMQSLESIALVIYGVLPLILAVGGLIAGLRHNTPRAALCLLCGSGLAVYTTIMFYHVRVGISLHAFFLFLSTLYLNYTFFPREHTTRRTVWFVIFYMLFIGTYLRGIPTIYRLGSIGLERYKNAYIADENAQMPDWIRNLVRNIVNQEAETKQNKNTQNQPDFKCYTVPEEIINRIQADNKNGGIWTDIFSAPEVLWKTDKPTFGGPYHTNLAGLTDLFRIQLDRPPFNTAKRLLKQRNITQLFVMNPKCFNYFTQKDNPEQWEEAVQETFTYHLYHETKKMPRWVQLEYTDPETNIKLFRLNFDEKTLKKKKKQ